MSFASRRRTSSGRADAADPRTSRRRSAALHRGGAARDRGAAARTGARRARLQSALLQSCFPVLERGTSPSVGHALPEQPRCAGRALQLVAGCCGPLQKLFWNPTPLISALSRQSDLNGTYVHLLHNLAVEATRQNRRSGPEDRLLQLQGRLELQARREKAGVAAPRARRRSPREPGGAGRIEPGAGPRAPAPGRAGLRRRVSETRRWPSGGTSRGGVPVGHLRGEGAPPHGAPGAAALAVSAGLLRGTVFLFHFSIGSAAGRLIYHAPDRWSRSTTTHAGPLFLGSIAPGGPLPPRPARARRVRPRTELALGDSEYTGASWRPRAPAHRRAPIVLDLGRYRRPPSPVMRSLVAGRNHELLFVGRHHPQQTHRGPDRGVRPLPSPQGGQPPAPGG